MRYCRQCHQWFHVGTGCVEFARVVYVANGVDERKDIRLRPTQRPVPTEEELLGVLRADTPLWQVQQNAKPAMHDEPIVPNTPAMGSESKRPMLGCPQASKNSDIY